ncbi:chromosome segregation and condensation protein ScpB [Kosmotoga arenicorallina S304]|uniref:Chromosome segregation and condensation protein ScpB n=1 Tax=Kosmotoga arenicorallina S304 TaxID=1453497 RepID=A0A176K3C6_9BACT|nr:SMC-Scp complex subunit ScpB [Kosmotoga arenicorallina]OAA31516.1 chromosome segregation and condensation protein ScpB [Kosmotoga arenicorallina S304]
MATELTRKAAVEALIFAAKQGIEPKKIAKILGMKLNQVMILIEELQEEYNNPNHGVNLKVVKGKLRFYTKKEVQKYVSQLSKRPIVSITDSQMEVLAIVAIRGPITRTDVELIRGRSSQSQLLELSRMKLIRKSKSKLPGRPYLYKVTNRFYDTFQINDLSEIVQGLELPLGEVGGTEGKASKISSEEHESVPKESR